MAATRRQRAGYGDEPAAELTSGQLVAAICLLCVTHLLVFLLGIVVGNFDTTLQAGKTGGLPLTGEQSIQTAVQSGGDGLGAQTSPRPDTLPGARSSSASAQQAALAGPRTVEIEAPARRPSGEQSGAAAPPASRQQPPADNELATRAGQILAAAAAPSQPAAPERAEPPPERDTAPPPERRREPAASAPATAAAPSSQPQQTRPATPAGERWSVQLASYSVNNRPIAETQLERLKRNGNIEAELVPSEDGRWLRMMVGVYPSRSQAEERQKELSQRPGLADCIVVRRP